MIYQSLTLIFLKLVNPNTETLPAPEVLELPIENNNSTQNSGSECQLNNIKFEFHLNSGKSETIYTFKKFCQLEDEAEAREQQTQTSPTPQVPSIIMDHGPGIYIPINNTESVLNTPWRPFRSRQDFELAELILETHMNTWQIKTMLELVWEIIPNDARSRSPLNLESHTDLTKMWKLARGNKSFRGILSNIYYPF